MTTLYGIEIRAALCDHCGAPIQSTIHGGQVRCSYCRTVSTIERRRVPPSRATTSGNAGIPERERLRQLRLQDHRPLELPPRLYAWIRGGELEEQYRDDALREWLAARAALKKSGDPVEGERVFLLALYLAPALEDGHARALLENTVDILPTVVDQDVIRCMLAHHAALDGDLGAAKAWLDWCEPRPRLLLSDTAYRFASCTIALQRGDPGEVLRLLGHAEGEVPIFDGYDDEAELFRCHALEQLGRGQLAYERLFQRVRHPAALKALATLVSRDPRLPLCPATWPRVEADAWSEIDQVLVAGLRGQLSPLASNVVLGLALPMFVAPIGFHLGGSVIGAAAVALPIVITIAWAAHRVTVERALVARARRAYARVLSSRWISKRDEHRSWRVCGAVLDLIVDGERVEVVREIDEGWAHPRSDLPCLYDPQTGALFVMAPAEGEPPRAPPLPFG